MLPQFDISTYFSQIFWFFISFGLLYFMISKFIIPKAQNIIESREKLLEADSNAANELELEAQNLREFYNRERKAIVGEAENIKKEAIVKLSSLTMEKTRIFNQEMEEKMREADQELERAVASFSTKKSQASIDLAAFIASKLIGKEVDKEALININKKFQ